jgi:hypothetical protein
MSQLDLIFVLALGFGFLCFCTGFLLQLEGGTTWGVLSLLCSMKLA